jgi:hypothetical protein
MKTPSLIEIELNKDNQKQLARWYRFCKCETPQDVESIRLICKYFKGFTPVLSKEIGWNE